MTIENRRQNISSFQALNDKLDELTHNLEKSGYSPEPFELEQEGFELKLSYSHEMPDDAIERTVKVYENKAGERVVLHEVFQDKEGGMYQNAAFADKESVLKWMKPAIKRSLAYPDQFLVESVLSVNLPKDVESLYRDSRNSYGCAHFKWILEDEKMQTQVLKSYLENKKPDYLIGREKEIYRAAKELYAQLNSK